MSTLEPVLETVTFTISRENASREPGEVASMLTDCIVARALSEATGDEWSCGLEFAYRIKQPHRAFLLPEKVANIILHWSQGWDVSRMMPLTFTATEIPGTLAPENLF